MLKKYQYQIFIILSAVLLFIPFLGGVHLFDWDEINFAESAREMIVTGDYLNVRINYQLFWEKPPLFLWMQVLSMKIFGVTEFAARFPNAVCGVVTLLVLFAIGKKLYNQTFALIWVLAYAGSVLPHFYFKSGIIDPWFNLFIFSGIYFIIEYFSQTLNKKRNIILSAVFIGAAVLTKGPVGLLIFGLTGLVYLIFKRFKVKISFSDILLYSAVVAIIGGLWFILQMANGNTKIIEDFIVYQIRLFSTQDAGHGGFFGYHFVILFLGVFPASVFALPAFKGKNNEEPVKKDFKLWILIQFWVVLILFSIVKTKIVHYSSFCYFPLTFLAAWVINNLIENRFVWKKWINILLISIASVISLLIIVLQYVAVNASQIIQSGIIKDKFANGNLEAQVSWTGFEFLVGLILLGGIIFSVFYFKQQQIKQRVIGIFVSSLLFTNLTILILVPRIEKYSQNAAIEFYKSKQTEDCYMETIGFKSYADLYYFNKPNPEKRNSLNDEWLLTGDIDKPAYFVCKNTKEKKYTEKYPDLVKLYQKNGFVFFVRNPKKSN